MSLADYYVRFIQWIGNGTGAPDTILHIHAGMAVLLLTRVVTGRSLATPVPLASVYIAELANEILDYFGHGRLTPDTLSDVINTVFWPTILFIGLRVRRARLERHLGEPAIDNSHRSVYLRPSISQVPPSSALAKSANSREIIHTGPG